MTAPQLSPSTIEAIDLNIWTAPEHLRAGLRAYFVERALPGEFLQALLRNDLSEAVLRADPTSLRGLSDLVIFLHNSAPRTSFGSPAAVEQWLASGAAAAGEG